MFKDPHNAICGHKKKVCRGKTFPLGHFMLHFIMILIRQMTTKATNDETNNYTLDWCPGLEVKWKASMMITGHMDTCASTVRDLEFGWKPHT